MSIRFPTAEKFLHNNFLSMYFCCANYSFVFRVIDENDVEQSEELENRRNLRSNLLLACSIDAIIEKKVATKSPYIFNKIPLHPVSTLHLFVLYNGEHILHSRTQFGMSKCTLVKFGITR